ncbi:MAG TPA: hypothetical protein VGX25_14520 [Actinophytocola sp.]|uniref:hypothetical protein n=1 Tax=Actinophytocola sp. TaxID=1872138 RepID=UPI002DDD45A2|nr:hypothetical protein [Actinophytocola sp.]HEV2780601.1 hypothetical protein [Actinophytocola sp.]
MLRVRPAGSGQTIEGVAPNHYYTTREASMWMQIVAVAVVAVVFLVRLVFALHDRPSKPEK